MDEKLKEATEILVRLKEISCNLACEPEGNNAASSKQKKEKAAASNRSKVGVDKQNDYFYTSL